MFWQVDGPDLVLVEPGVYELAFIEYYTAVMFGRALKIVMVFEIVDPGEYFGLRVQRYYNAKKLIGKPGKNGRFNVARNSDFLREYATVFNHVPSRADRVPIYERFRNAVVKGEVSTVTADSKQNAFPSVLHYSKVSRLTGLVVGEK